MLSEMIKNRLVEMLRNEFDTLMAVFLFGSQSKGTCNSNSDIDLAVLVEGYAEPLLLWNVGQMLAAQLNVDIDLIDLRAVSSVFQAQILLQGECLWSKDSQSDLTVCAMLTEKLHLDEKRQKQLREITAGGKIYG